MHQVHYHKVTPDSDTIQIIATDDPGVGQARHRYEISGFETGTNVSLARSGPEPKSRIILLFQNGPISEVGVNGITHEALLAVVADRLRAFQAGPYACRENAMALTKVEEAMHWLDHRTLARVRRGVEGTHAV